MEKKAAKLKKLIMLAFIAFFKAIKVKNLNIITVWKDCTSLLPYLTVGGGGWGAMGISYQEDK